MAQHARSAFTVDHTDSEPGPFEGGELARTRLRKTFTGELAGSSTVEAIMIGLDGDGPKIYVGVERFDCALNGSKGTFALLHSATHHADGGIGAWTIVPGSGTGELAGLTGTAEIRPGHEFVLAYEL